MGNVFVYPKNPRLLLPRTKTLPLLAHWVAQGPPPDPVQPNSRIPPQIPPVKLIHIRACGCKHLYRGNFSSYNPNWEYFKSVSVSAFKFISE